MRRITFFVSNTLLSGALLLPVTGLCADMVVGGRPDVYNSVPSAGAIQNLNDQYSRGALTFSQYQSNLAELTHPVNEVSRSVVNSVAPIDLRSSVIAKSLGQSSAFPPVAHTINPQDMAVVSVSSATPGLCAAGYTDYSQPGVVFGTSTYTLDTCQQEILLDPVTQQYQTNSYSLVNGAPELFVGFIVLGNPTKSITAPFGHLFGEWDQVTGTASFANFFVSDQADADNIVQQANANNWPVTFAGQNSQGYYQVQVQWR